MLSKLPTIFKVGIAIILLFQYGCKKDETENVLKISDVSYSFSELNNCADGFNTGTLFNFNVLLSNPKNQIIKSIVVDYEYSFFEYGAIPIYSFSESTSQIEFSCCFWFDYFEDITLNFRVLTADYDQSTMFTLVIPKPVGAN